jgi:hypothetical protein
MDAPLPLNPVSPGWMVFCGIIVAGATLKEVVSRVAQSPLAAAPKRPSLAGSMVVGLLLKHAVGRIGSGATGLPPGP